MSKKLYELHLGRARAWRTKFVVGLSSNCQSRINLGVALLRSVPLPKKDSDQKQDKRCDDKKAVEGADEVTVSFDDLRFAVLADLLLAVSLLDHLLTVIAYVAGADGPEAAQLLAAGSVAT